MAATAQWIEIPFTLTSPYATLTLNAASGDRYLLRNSLCEMGADIRSTSDNVPQADGSILHHRFFTGYHCRLAVDLWRNDFPACDADLVRMIDTLNGVCWSLLNAGDNQGRLSWLPTGAGDQRMLDDIRLAEKVLVSAPEGAAAGYVVTFAVDTQYPYAQNLTPTVTPLNATITNLGTAEYWPVFKVYGNIGAGGFTLTNTTTGLSIVYDTAQPGAVAIPGGSYVEIDTFRNTAYLNGSSSDCMGGIVMDSTDFWSLQPGANVCTIAGAPSCTVEWASAWA